MSHFSVIVIGPDPEAQLRPFHQYECTGIVDEYVKEVDRTEEARDDYEKYSKNGEPFEEFIKGWFGDTITSDEPMTEGFKTRIDSDGRVFSLTNPDYKWDWYTIGGRWSGWLLKDQAPRSEFDFDLLRSRAANEAGADWDAVWKGGYEPPNDIKTFEDFEGDGEAWAEYDRWLRGLPFAQRAFDRGFVLGVREFLVDRETYVGKARDAAISPFAMVAEGRWAARGDMGWFGMSTSDVPSEDWNKRVSGFLECLAPETLLTVVDCHI